MLKTLKDVKKELKKKTRGSVSQRKPSLSEQEKQLIRSIREETAVWNKNNVTRTERYLHFYLKHPEIHWAFLGHMVSRNGGWNMTDLKGELFTKLLSQKEQDAFFTFLERGNWLIFQDIYPQFLLYEESLKRRRSLFYLLPYLNVSTFMETMWQYFLESRDAYTLAMALIINEQSYLEERVIQNKTFKKAVLGTVGFKVYDFFRFNHILFPYYNEASQKTALVGVTSTQFTSLHRRILLGKRLYDLLFREDIFPGALRWAKNHPHTGSRSDYWPHVFTSVNASLPRGLYKRRLRHCQIIDGQNRLYSPPLKYAWPNRAHQEAEQGDWFQDWRAIRYVYRYDVKTDGRIHHDYCRTLEKIELAILAKSTLPREEAN